MYLQCTAYCIVHTAYHMKTFISKKRLPRARLPGHIAASCVILFTQILFKNDLKKKKNPNQNNLKKLKGLNFRIKN